MKNLFLSVISLSVIIFAGCQNQSQNTNSQTINVTPQITCSILNFAENDNLVHLTEKWDVDDKIGIYMFKAGAKQPMEKKINKCYVTNLGDGQFLPIDANETIYLPSDGSSVDFFAYYPWANLTDNKYKIDLSTQTDQKAIDLLMGSSKSKNGRIYNITNPSVGFEFKHRLSKIIMDIKPIDGLKMGDLKGLEVIINHQSFNGNYDLVAQRLIIAQNLNTSIKLFTSADGTSCEGIIFPNEKGNEVPAAGRSFQFKIKGGSQISYKINTPEFEAGKKYVYHVSIGATKLSVKSEIMDWANGNGKNGEDVNVITD